MPSALDSQKGNGNENGGFAEYKVPTLAEWREPEPCGDSLRETVGSSYKESSNGSMKTMV